MHTPLIRYLSHILEKVKSIKFCQTTFFTENSRAIHLLLGLPSSGKRLNSHFSIGTPTLNVSITRFKEQSNLFIFQSFEGVVFFGRGELLEDVRPPQKNTSRLWNTSMGHHRIHNNIHYLSVSYPHIFNPNWE